MLSNPLARTNDVVVQKSGNEFLVYDLGKNKAICLNETSALVWQLCDGKHSVSEISDKMSQSLSTLISEDLVWLALDQFRKEGLLVDDEIVANHFVGISRREVIRKVGIATMVALPLVSAIVAPKSINAQSCAGSGNSFNYSPQPDQASCISTAQANCCSGQYTSLVYDPGTQSCTGTCF